VIDGACSAQELGVHFGAGLTAREIEYLVQREWAVEADDVLWRRTKAGLHLDEAQRRAVARHILALRAPGRVGV
jgi:glycerol-3-phosphate dehydrogenase